MNDEEVKSFLVDRLNVSHETLLKLEGFVTFLMQWNMVHNLVSQGSLSELWCRHLLDSAQLIAFINADERVVDFGSGAGFPGMILAILGRQVLLVERNKKKVAFLTEIARRLSLDVVIKNQSIEETKIEKLDIITARGVAKIDLILAMTEHSISANTKYLLQKGKEWREELDAAATKWDFVEQIDSSVTSGEGKIVTLTKVSRRHE